MSPPKRFISILGRCNFFLDELEDEYFEQLDNASLSFLAFIFKKELTLILAISMWSLYVSTDAYSDSNLASSFCCKIKGRIFSSNLLNSPVNLSNLAIRIFT